MKRAVTTDYYRPGPPAWGCLFMMQQDHTLRSW